MPTTKTKAATAGAGAAAVGTPWTTLIALAGIILRYGPHWFSGQHWVGDLLLWVSFGPLLIVLAIVAVCFLLAGLIELFS